ncbi:MAG: histidine kinase [Bacteroidales bacterium]|nr:histidine kinase [Bacteroidales bacterium]
MSKDKPVKQDNRKITLLFHLSVLALVIILNPPNALDHKSLVYYVVTRIFPLGAFYICYFWLVPNYLAKKKILTFIILLLVVLNLITMIGLFTVQIVHNVLAEINIHLFINWKIQISGMFAMTVAAIFGVAFRSIFGWYEEMNKKSMLEKEKVQGELLLLKARVNPHFLFNTLNSIDFLISSNPSKASESLIKLSSLLRYVIYDTINDQVTLQKEIEQMEDYVELQRLRYDEIGSVICEITGDPSGKMIAPMLFMPFIENAFKHTDEAGMKKGLTILFHIDKNHLEFICRNYISAKENIHNGGFGLENIKKRLEMQYPDNYKLTINKTDQVYTVTLTLNLL